MAQFQYRAADGDGRIVEGMIEAPARAQAASRLQERGLIPLRVDAPGEGGRSSLLNLSLPQLSAWRNRIGKGDLLVFTHEMHTLLVAGLPLDRSLQILGELSTNPEMQRVVGDVLQSVQRGKSLAESLGQHPRVFEPLFVNMVRAGEIGGVLDTVLGRLTEYLERATELRDEVRSAMVYPVILLTTSLASVMVLLVYVLPKFTAIFTQGGAVLPLSARVLVTASEVMRGWWWLGLLVVGFGAAGFVRWVRTTAGRLRWDRFSLEVPLFGDLTRKVAVARFARTLGTLLNSGVPMLQSLDIVREVTGNVVLEAAIDEVKTGVRGGAGVAGPLSHTGVFPALALQMISVGEETGRLDQMLVSVADYFDKEVRGRLKRLTGMLEPILLVFGGLVVGFVVLSMFSAIFSMNNMPL